MWTISMGEPHDGTVRVWACRWTREQRYPAVIFEVEVPAPQNGTGERQIMWLAREAYGQAQAIGEDWAQRQG